MPVLRLLADATPQSTHTSGCKPEEVRSSARWSACLDSRPTPLLASMEVLLLSTPPSPPSKYLVPSEVQALTRRLRWIRAHGWMGLPRRQLQHIIIIWYLTASYSGPFFFLSHLENQVSHLSSFRLDSRIPICWPLACYLNLFKSLIVLSSQALLPAFLLPHIFVLPLLRSRDEAISVFDFNKLEPDSRIYPVDVDTTRTKRSISLRNANLD